MTTIHPLLRLRDSSKWRPGLRVGLIFPPKHRQLGRHKIFSGLIKLCDEEEGSLNLTQNERAMLFPILYRHLDPASIPSVADLDSAAIPDYIVARVNGVVLTLSDLIRPIKELKPTAAAPDLWPRVCPWLEFLHTYRGLFPNLPAFEEIELDGPGLRTIIAATWGEYVHEHFSLPHNKHNKLCMQSEALAMLTPETTQPGSLEQIIDGVGGSDDHLAALLIEHINQAADSEDISRFLDIGVVFLSTLPRYLLPTLLEHGMVRSLVSAMRKLQTHPSYLQECSTARSTAALVYFLRAHPRSAWISEALENGLLQFISQCSVDYIGPMQVEPEFLPNFERLLWEVLPRALVFYDVVAQMKFLLPDAEKLIATRTTQDYGIPAFAKQWTPFATLAKQRIAALEWWETSGRPFSQACDNMLCGRIDSRQKFRRCSGCAHATYCSRDCQRADWEAAHREICADFRSVLPDPYFPRRRDRGFAHILAGIDFQRLRRTPICRLSRLFGS
ncbi:hypothetical protein FB45DRAFT_1061838 [Roridomyces roridus]|uniref:MYND-type domain-containing protein n=1 Tax=Roridomyces roridus TaxID=1738132 RepID=A0AAD7BIN7_9AGAR|nr:hypothetical protein FB45DRAFT_1061838 [Roridomyces roridus]